jgi:hypothetical protein
MPAGTLIVELAGRDSLLPAPGAALIQAQHPARAPVRPAARDGLLK